MPSQASLAIPHIPELLKAVSPYIQRTHELRNQDPIMAYWCAYYAAQIGISLKAKDSSARDFLFALLGALENLKREIGPHDALDIEAVSSAYVENFALKVFAMADNEDRAGKATRSTAKKFLAAANFLEVLKIFPKADISESATDKIKYAKWKAADIAKAFREGRKPTPGPADSLNETSDATPHGSPSEPTQHNPIHIVHPKQSSGSSSGSDRSIKRNSPPGPINIRHANSSPFDLHAQTPPRFQGSHLAVPDWDSKGDVSPGSWSTAATPGTATTPQDASIDWEEQPSPTKPRSAGILGRKPRSGSGSSSGSSGSGGILKNVARVGGETQPLNANERYPVEQPGFLAKANSDDSSKKSVHFTPSVTGGLSDTTSVADSSVPSSPSYDERAFPSVYANGTMTNPYGPPQSYSENPGIDLSVLPPGFVPDPHQGVQSLPMRVSPPMHISPPTMPSHDPYAPVPETDPTRRNIYAPPPQRLTPSPPTSQNHHVSVPPPPPPPPSQPIIELTPSVIAKAQKHCRFAISALDYEDAEQARKELRTALATLGG